MASPDPDPSPDKGQAEPTGPTGTAPILRPRARLRLADPETEPAGASTPNPAAAALEVATRPVHLQADLRLRFPGRSPAFVEGVEIGTLATLMAQHVPHFDQRISSATVPQARALAQRLGYRLATSETGEDGYVDVTLTGAWIRPHLVLVANEAGVTPGG